MFSGIKLWLILGAIAAIGVLGWKVNDWRVEAGLKDAAIERANDAEKGRKDDMAEIVKRLDKDAADRKVFNDRLEAIDKRFDDIKIPDPKVLVQTREVPGACPIVGVSSDFVRVFNDSSTP